MFSISSGCILAVILIVLLYPLARFAKRPILMGEEAVLDEQQVSLAIEKTALLRTLSELEVHFAQGKMTADDYNRIKLTSEHRLLNILEGGATAPAEITGPQAGQPALRASRLVGAVGEEASPSLVLGDPAGRLLRPGARAPWGLMLGMGIWIVAGAFGVSTLVHGKISKSQLALQPEEVRGEVAGPTGMPDPVKMVARLEERLKANPNDLNGQMMLGRSYMVLDRWENAEKTWKKVLEIDERNPTAHASLGEILLRTHAPGDQKIAEQALAHFDKAMISSPQDPSINWGRGVALVQLGRVAEADTAWTETFRALTPGSQEADMVKKALEALRSGKIKSS
jgi:cytochrome c-type biogenesis protein CcmH/NrfG